MWRCVWASSSDVLKGLGAFVFRDSEDKEDAHLDCFILKSKTLRSVERPAITLRCVIPVVCVTNEREEKIVEQHN